MDRQLRIRMLLEASDRVTRPLRDIAGGSRAATGALKETKDRLRELERTQADVTSFRKLKGELRGVETEMEGAQAKVAGLARQMRETSNPSRQLTRDFEKAKREAAQLRGEHDWQSQALQQIRGRLREAGVGTADLTRHERELREQITRTNRELTEQADRLGRADARARRFADARERFGKVQGMASGMAASGAAGIATGVVLARPIIGAVTEAQEYESVMTDIAQKANLSRVQAAGMGRELLEAARAANQMPDELQKGVDTLSGFGLDPRRAVAMMKPIGRAATAYKAEIADLSAAAFAANDNLKVPVEQTGRVIDVMALAGKAGAFEIKDMAGAFPSLTAGYQALGQTGVGAVADLAAALQIARKGAGDSSTAANNVANIIQKISSPATIKAFSKFGIDLPAALKKAYAEGKTPLEAIAELTRKATGGDLGKMGFLFEDAQVQQGLRPLIQNMEEYRRIRAEAFGARGTTDTDFAERLKDSGERSKQLKIQATALGISLGTVLLPTLNEIAARASVFATRLADLSQRHPTLTRVAVFAAVAITGLFFALGAGAIVLAAIMGPIAIINAGLVAMGFAGGIAAIGLLPIIGTIAAVAGAAALLFAAFNHWDTITAAWLTFWGTLRQGFVTAGAFITTWAPWVGGQLMNGLLQMLNPMTLVRRVKALGTSMIGALRSVLDIHSPSRVFASLGGFMMQGLVQGIDRDADRPVRRVTAVARLAAAAMAAGAVSPVMARPAISAARPIAVRSLDLLGQVQSSDRARRAAPIGSITATRSPPPAPLGPISITINPAPTQSPQDIAREVEQALLRIQARAAADRRASYRDDSDGADL